MVEVQVARKDAPAAISQLRKVLVIKPGHPPAVGMLVTLLARTGKLDEAIALAKSVQVDKPAEPIGWSMEGDLQDSKGNRPLAITAYRTALSKVPQSEVAVKLHRALMDAGQAAEAKKFETDWRGKHSDDAFFNYYIADRFLAAGDLAAAEPLFRQVLTVNPKQVTAMNNLAWILHRTNKPGGLELVEKAMALQPNSAAILDTAAEIQAGTSHLEKALALQRRAVELDPEQPVHRLHLAQYLLRDNQKVAARNELQRLAQLGANFAQQDEVQKLLAQP
jgi:predicted Zn-dependent protease